MKNLCGSFLIICLLFTSCTDYHNQVHVDETKKAIIPCDGGYLNKVRIETPEITITYEGVDTVFFDKPTNASRITVGYDKINSKYILKLVPNSKYTIYTRSRNFDQARWRKIIRINQKGDIIHDLENSTCN